MPLRCRTRLQPIRTAATTQLSFEILSPFDTPKYLINQDKIVELRRLGMTQVAIAKALGINERMVWRTLTDLKKAGKARSTTPTPNEEDSQ
jgi:hypothetical protein